MNWQRITFEQLSTHQLYHLLQLRSAVFVVEQECAFLDLDDLDTHQHTQHLLGYMDGKLIAYARLLPPDLAYSNKSSIGRVVVATEFRRLHLGDQLVQKAIEETQTLWQDTTISIGAQFHLRHFYQKHGFIDAGEPYMEDGIKHITMHNTFTKAVSAK